MSIVERVKVKFFKLERSLVDIYVESMFFYCFQICR